MKIAVMGAGAVGCYFGGMLARAGNDVTLIGRQTHVDAIRERGLFLETASFQERIEVKAVTGPGDSGDANVILFTVKSSATEVAGKLIAPYVGTGALVLSMQNGIDNAGRLAAVLQRPAHAVAVYVAAEMKAPGHVKHHGRGDLVIGTGVMSTDRVRQFETAGVPVRVSDNVDGELWAKLILNCAYNALSAVTKLSYGQLIELPSAKLLMRAVVEECLSVARRADIAVPGDSWDAVERLATAMPGQLSSTAQDLLRGRQSEIDYLNGEIVRRGAASGIDTPVNETLYRLVKLLESAVIAAATAGV